VKQTDENRVFGVRKEKGTKSIKNGIFLKSLNPSIRTVIFSLFIGSFGSPLEFRL